jgi:hypothetical protein
LGESLTSILHRQHVVAVCKCDLCAVTAAASLFLDSALDFV